MAAPVASRAFFHDTVFENVSTVVASQADLGCFDSTAACAALPLSMTGVEKVHKVTHSERSEAQAERVEGPEALRMVHPLLSTVFDVALSKAHPPTQSLPHDLQSPGLVEADP